MTMNEFPAIQKAIGKRWLEDPRNREHPLLILYSKRKWDFLEQLNHSLELLFLHCLCSKSIKNDLKNAKQFEDTINEIRVASHLIENGTVPSKIGNGFPDIEVKESGVIIEIKNLHPSQKLLVSKGEVVEVDDIQRLWSRITAEIIPKLNPEKINLILIVLPIGMDFDEILDLFIFSEKIQIEEGSGKVLQPKFEGEFSRPENTAIAGIIILKNNTYKGLTNPLSNKDIPVDIMKVFGITKVVIKDDPKRNN